MTNFKTIKLANEFVNVLKQNSLSCYRNNDNGCINLFAYFLLNYNIYSEFFFNSTTKERSYTSYFDDIINRAFSWSKTEQKHHFWEVIHHLWSGYVVNNRMEIRPNKLRNNKKMKNWIFIEKLNIENEF